MFASFPGVLACGTHARLCFILVEMSVLSDAFDYIRTRSNSVELGRPRSNTFNPVRTRLWERHFAIQQMTSAHAWTPLSAAQDVLRVCLFLSQCRDRFCSRRGSVVCSRSYLDAPVSSSMRCMRCWTRRCVSLSPIDFTGRSIRPTGADTNTPGISSSPSVIRSAFNPFCPSSKMETMTKRWAPECQKVTN